MKRNAILYGLVAGAAGVAAMTLAEKVEQQFTGRPNSYVPGRTLKTLLRKPAIDQETPFGYNWAMHWGQCILLGAVRGLMAERRLRGPMGSFFHWNLRLVNNQTLENATGVGAPPWTWPVDEQIIDLIHSGMYAFTTGAVTDAVVPGPRGAPEPRQPWLER